MTTDFIGFAYSLVIIAGGVMGLLTKGSIMSCVMGVGSGLLAGVAAYRSSQEYKYKQIIHFESEAFLKLERSLRSQWDPRQWGMSMLVSGVLFILMSARFIQSGKIFPAGVVASLSFLMIIKCLYVALSVDKRARS